MDHCVDCGAELQYTGRGLHKKRCRPCQKLNTKSRQKVNYKKWASNNVEHVKELSRKTSYTYYQRHISKGLYHWKRSET